MPISLSGGSCGVQSDSLNLTYARPVVDPYLRNTSLQSAMTTNYPQSTPTTVNKKDTALPASPNNHYSLLPSTSLTLKPGVYYFDNIDTASGSPVITGDGVTLIFSPNIKFPTNLPTFNITPPLPPKDISDPNTCPFCGISIASKSSMPFKLTGGELFTGSVYLPNSAVTYTGNTKETCLQLVSDTIDFTGNSTLTNDISKCPFYQNQLIKQTVVDLVQ